MVAEWHALEDPDLSAYYILHRYKDDRAIYPILSDYTEVFKKKLANLVRILF